MEDYRWTFYQIEMMIGDRRRIVLMEMAQRNAVNLQMFEDLLLQLAASCTKQNISNASSCFMQTVRAQETMLLQILTIMVDANRNFSERQHLIYLMNDILQTNQTNGGTFCMTTKATNDLQVYILCFMFIMLLKHDDDLESVNRLIDLWATKGYFCDRIVKDMKSAHQTFYYYVAVVRQTHCNDFHLLMNIERLNNELLLRLSSKSQSHEENIHQEIERQSTPILSSVPERMDIISGMKPLMENGHMRQFNASIPPPHMQNNLRPLMSPLIPGESNYRQFPPHIINRPHDLPLSHSHFFRESDGYHRNLMDQHFHHPPPSPLNNFNIPPPIIGEMMPMSQPPLYFNTPVGSMLRSIGDRQSTFYRSIDTDPMKLRGGRMSINRNDNDSIHQFYIRQHKDQMRENRNVFMKCHYRNILSNMEEPLKYVRRLTSNPEMTNSQWLREQRSTHQQSLKETTDELRKFAEEFESRYQPGVSMIMDEITDELDKNNKRKRRKKEKEMKRQKKNGTNSPVDESSTTSNEHDSNSSIDDETNEHDNNHDNYELEENGKHGRKSNSKCSLKDNENEEREEDEVDEEDEGESIDINKGFKVMKSLGYSGGGLGRHGQGITQPIERGDVRIKDDHMGIGSVPSEFESFRRGKSVAYHKRTRAPNPK
ncbi:hypothetical protein SNEBB_005310 [Seison nebaliae]|nr:hypothetical protein SNEBB_005310 [Seison nebaliae]